MALAGRCSELQHLVFDFDSKYVQFKSKGAGVTLYFSPEFMPKNLIRSKTPGTFQQSLVASQILVLLTAW